MLAKIAPAGNDFHALARYLVRGKPGSATHPDRVAWVQSQNLPTEDPELAAAYMSATAGLSARTRRAAYHLMIAWHARERPHPAAMQQIARETLELAGLSQHQALIMGHGDKPHPHLHILLNRVHPESGRAWRTANDYIRFDRIMAELANKHGFDYAPSHAFALDATDELPKKPNSPATYAARRGAPTNRLQWSRKSARDLGARVSERLSPASTLDDIAWALAEFGLTLQQKGRGLIAGDRRSYAKFSQLGLMLSAQDRARLLLTHRPWFAIDGVDVVRALRGMGVLDTADLRKAIDERKRERMNRQARRDLAKRLSVDPFGLTALTPPGRSRCSDRRLPTSPVRSR